MTVSLVEILGLDLLSKVGSKISELEAENAELRDQLRWRQWPHKKPTETGCHMVRLPGKCFTMTGYWNCFEEWDLKYEWFYWMPQIPLPGGE